jgi:hypothetical protein
MLILLVGAVDHRPQIAPADVVVALKHRYDINISRCFCGEPFGEVRPDKLSAYKRYEDERCLTEL